MILNTTQPLRRVLCLAVIVLMSVSAVQVGHAESVPEDVAVPWLEASSLDDKLHGLVLLDELGCVACHSTEAPLAKSSKVAPRLSVVGSRVNPYYLERFIQNPRALKPGTTMPDVMRKLKGDERRETARAITHYLLSLTGKSGPFDLHPIDTVAAEEGEQLFHSVGCVACHSPRNKLGQEIMAGDSVPLGDLEQKYNTRSLAEFLRAPHKIRPSGRMPDMKLNGREAEQLANYLLRKTEVPGHLRYTLLRGRVWEGLDVNVTKEKAGLVKDFDLASLMQLPGNSAVIYEGFLNVKKTGQYTFYLEMNGGQLLLDDEEVANLSPSPRRGVKKTKAIHQLREGWNKIQLTYIHAGKEPYLKFEMAGPGIGRQAIDASVLSISQTPIAPYRQYKVDQALAAQGKIHFTKLGCVSCHGDVPSNESAAEVSKPLAKLDPFRGCLSEGEGPWPHFRLSATQREAIRAVLPEVESTQLTQQQLVNKSLVTFNCIACHQREGLGGVSPERDPYFVGTKVQLGNEGRIPPPLTHVGAKLQTSWINEVMLHGKEQREYLATRMPQSGEANVGHLVNLFEKVDTLEEVTFDEIENVERYKAAGHQLVGTTGFSCIACHDFNGQKASGPGAMDIIHSTERLKKKWFYLFLLKPSRFHPSTIMPEAWPGGFAFKKDILDGDSKRQIESIWIYLKDGVRAKNPIGLSRKSPELRVTDEAVICRGRGNAGYRGIAVGYPERLSLAFDSQEMNLCLLWKGKFARVNPGSFSAIGDNRISFAAGIPFHRLETLDDNWPYKRKTDYLFPQDHGYRFGGYYLGPKKRPTFMYRYGDIRVEEYFEDGLDQEQNAYFRRTFTFDSPKTQKKFYFRAATAKNIALQHEETAAPKNVQRKRTTFTADRLKVTILGPHRGIIRDGDPQELLIPLELPQGESKLVLEYRW